MCGHNSRREQADFEKLGMLYHSWNPTELPFPAGQWIIVCFPILWVSVAVYDVNAAVIVHFPSPIFPGTLECAVKLTWFRIIVHKCSKRHEGVVVAAFLFTCRCHGYSTKAQGSEDYIDHQNWQFTSGARNQKRFNLLTTPANIKLVWILRRS